MSVVLIEGVKQKYKYPNVWELFFINDELAEWMAIYVIRNKKYFVDKKYELAHIKNLISNYSCNDSIRGRMRHLDTVLNRL